MNEVCEWFEEYLDNKDNVLVFKFSDGTVKRAELGAYLNTASKSLAYQVGYSRGLEAGRKGESK